MLRLSNKMFGGIRTWSKLFASNIQCLHPKTFKYKKSNFNLRLFQTKTPLYHEQIVHTGIKFGVLSPKRIVGVWLLTCSGMVFVAVALGGVTRLTESGLSMVTWKLLGEKMPHDEVTWIKEFQKYQEFPEYKISNASITLEEFKKIWWMEYIHRMWGRLIGAMFLLPVGYFWSKKMLDKAVKKKILLIGTLIACQGLMGWYMVKSGLENKFDGPSEIPRVSQYRLAAHLMLAFIIYGSLLYTALDHLLSEKYNIANLDIKTVQLNLKKVRIIRSLAFASIALTFLTATSGAFVAGLDAGLIYNSFPKMANKWIPDDILHMTPTAKNFTENPATVQFNHRLLGMLTLSTVTITGLISRKYRLSKQILIATNAMIAAAYLQVSLGILTLVNYVPTYLAAMHQSGSLLLLSTLMWFSHEIKYFKKIVK